MPPVLTASADDAEWQEESWVVRPLEAAAARSSSLGQMVSFRYVCMCVWVCGSGISGKEGKQTSVFVYLGGAVYTGS